MLITISLLIYKLWAFLVFKWSKWCCILISGWTKQRFKQAFSFVLLNSIGGIRSIYCINMGNMDTSAKIFPRVKKQKSSILWTLTDISSNEAAFSPFWYQYFSLSLTPSDCKCWYWMGRKYQTLAASQLPPSHASSNSDFLLSHHFCCQFTVSRRQHSLAASGFSKQPFERRAEGIHLGCLFLLDQLASCQARIYARAGEWTSTLLYMAELLPWMNPNNVHASNIFFILIIFLIAFLKCIKPTIKNNIIEIFFSKF